MKRPLILVLVAGVLMALVTLFYPKERGAEFNVGVIIPISHVALDDIVNGFKTELTEALGTAKVNIEVQNGLGDINLQKSAINNFINQKVDLLVPVSTGTTQMALSLAPKDLHILFLAANIDKDSALAKQKPKLMGVNDDISAATQASFIRASLPRLKKIALIYSSSDKVFDDVAQFVAAVKPLEIAVQKLMVQNVSELYTVSKRIDADADAIFILKDNVVASGIAALVQQADERHIPLISSDEGTCKSGAAFALGVVESDIGRQGGQIAASFLKDKKVLGIENIKRILVFINNEAAKRQGVNKEQILAAASSMNLEVFKE